LPTYRSPVNLNWEAFIERSLIRKRRMTLNSFNLKTSYVVLILLTLILSAFSAYLFFTLGELWLSGYLTNLGAGIIGSLIVIFLIDRIIEQNKEKERAKMQKIAFQRLRGPILQHVIMFVDIFKASSQNKPQQNPANYEDVFKDYYFQEMVFLDFSKDSGIAPARNWFKRIDSEMIFFRRKVEQTIDTYGAFLDVSTIETLEKMINSPFMRTMLNIKAIQRHDKDRGIIRVYTLLKGKEKFLREYTQLLLELINRTNSFVDRPIVLVASIWEDITPTWGSGRIEVPSSQISGDKGITDNDKQ
jgi:hypothetical protein